MMGTIAIEAATPVAAAASLGLSQTVLTVAGTILVALVTGFFTFLATRPKAKADVQTALNAGFKDLIDQLQAERDQLRSLVEKQSKRMSEMESDIRQMKQQIDSLERFIERNGLKPPPKPDLAPWRNEPEAT